MSKKETIISAIIIFVIIGIIIGGYYFVPYLQKSTNISDVNTKTPEGKTEAITPPTAEQQSAQIKKDYPEVIQGTISFFDTKNLLKTTIKTSDGKEYMLWPAQPKSVYESFGAKNGGRVEIQGRFSKDGNIEWGLMKPI